MIFRLSQKLAKKLGEIPSRSVPLDENPFADWSAHLFTAGRTQYIILTNTASLYSVVLYGRGITDGDLFIDQALSAIRKFLEDDGLALVYQRFIAPAGGTVQFSKTLNRSVTGSMNDLVFQAKVLLTEAETSPFELGAKLNKTPMSAIKQGTSGGYGIPRKVFMRLAENGGSATKT